ncbi:MAG: signal peptidase I [Saprospiraceae bacterium]|nr:signal peptidase I [Saprospiraceae bacterium]
MTLLLFLLAGYVIWCYAMSVLLPLTGRPSTGAWIPGTNFGAWAEMVGHKPRYALWLLFPIVNIFIYAGLCVDTARSFGKMSFLDAFLSVVFCPFYFLYLGRKASYQGPILVREREFHAQLEEAKEKNDTYQIKKLESRNPYRKSPLREWVEAIIFAVFAAAFIRMFLIEAYVIPTSSMEGSLLTGDFLFVSKANYGIRTPQTIAMIPLLHNRIPVLDRESYLEKPSLPYFRLPGWEKVKRNDPVVFNYPEGDSVIITPGRTWSYMDWARTNKLPPNFNPAMLTTRPMDKKDHYIKRCVGIPGDTLQIIDRQVHINGKPIQNPHFIQYRYRISSGGTPVNLQKLEEIGVNLGDMDQGSGTFNLDERMVERIKAMGPDIRVDILQQPVDSTSRYLFPHDPHIMKFWTLDNYGPVYIPKKGATVSVHPGNIAFYQRIIGVYEKNKLEVRNGQVWINDQPVQSYTFKMDYYWMMGDNRHYSEDSRVWGFVPEDHIVGKPLFIWLSAKGGSPANGIRWNRLFTNANKFEG